MLALDLALGICLISSQNSVLTGYLLDDFYVDALFRRPRSVRGGEDSRDEGQQTAGPPQGTHVLQGRSKIFKAIVLAE